MIRPGPCSIDPGACPGGVVLHVYDLAGVLVIPPRYLSPTMSPLELEADAMLAAALTAAALPGEAPLVVVTYDGDTGERFVLEGFDTGDVYR